MNADHSHVWRQKNAQADGALRDATKPKDVSPDMSFLEMLDVVNEGLDREGRGADRLRPRLPRGHLRHLRLGDQRRRPRPAAARPPSASSTCASFKDGDALTIEPWRAAAFPVIKDLVVDRSAFDRIIAGRRLRLRHHRQRARRQRHPGPQGERRARHGRRRLHRLRRLRRRLPERLRHALHRRAKVSHLALLPQGQPERDRRALAHGRGRWTRKASAAAPTTASARPSARRRSRIDFIARMNRDFIVASLGGERASKGGGGA